MTIQQYIDSVNQRFKQGNATEHRFRGRFAATARDPERKRPPHAGNG